MQKEANRRYFTCPSSHQEQVICPNDLVDTIKGTTQISLHACHI